MLSPNVASRVAPNTRLARGTFVRKTPRPIVAKPEAGKHHDGGGCIGAISACKSHMNIVGRLFCVLGKNIDIPIFCGGSGIWKLILWKFQTAPAVFLDELSLGECYLRVFMQCLEVRMGRRR